MYIKSFFGRQKILVKWKGPNLGDGTPSKMRPTGQRKRIYYCDTGLRAYICLVEIWEILKEYGLLAFVLKSSNCNRMALISESRISLGANPDINGV